MNAHTATPDRPNPVIELIRRLRKATHRPEPANDPTICAICGQWWQLDLPDGDFWEPISTLKAFLQFHPKWKAERKHRKARI